MKKILTIIILLLLPIPAFAATLDYQANLEELINTEIKQWSQKDILISAVREQNEKHADLSPTDLKILNTNWIGEKRKTKRTLTKSVMENELSNFLRKIQAGSDGVYTEIIVVDNRGLSVGQTIESENYWQGELPIWQKTFGSRSYANYIGENGFNDNTGLFQVEVSFMLVSNDEAIGMVYTGINVEQLEEWKKHQE